MNNPTDALIKLMQFVLEASGCNYQIPQSQNLPFDFGNILITATAHFGNKSVQYPMTMKMRYLLVKNISQFVKELMNSVISTPIILDDYFLKNITGFVMVAADSKVRAFRHTTTLIALKMMTALSATVFLANVRLRQIWLQLFAKVYLERCMDCVEHIRQMSAAEFGVWIKEYPNCYLNPDDVKYLFVSLQDNAVKVCECSFQALFKLHANALLRVACVEQGIKYRNTLLGLTMSAENEISQMAIQLVGDLYRSSPHILDENMQLAIESLVFAAHRGVAQAAAALVPFHYRDDISEPELLQILVKFFLRVAGHEHCAFLIDAYYGRNDIVLAWSSMISMLLTPPNLESWRREENSCLIEIMSRAIKQAVSGEVPPGRYTEYPVHQPLLNAKKLVATVLLPDLAALMRQYRDHSNDLRNLLELPQYMFLQGPQVKALLDQIGDMMFEEQENCVLRMGAQTLEHLYDQSDSNDNHCKQLLNRAVTNYIIASKQSPSEEPSQRLLVTLRLLSALYAHFDLREWQLSDPVLLILRQDSAPCPKALCLYLKLMYSSLSWDLKYLTHADNIDMAEECRALRQRLELFLLVTTSLIEHSTELKVSCTAFVCTCDLFCLFADELRQSEDTNILGLEYRTKSSDYVLLERFLERYVFADADVEAIHKLTQPEQFAQLQSKRRILTSYLKLSFHNVMVMMRTSIALQHYRTFHLPYGDIMRSLMERSIAMNPPNFGMTLMHTILMVYKRIRVNYPDASVAATSLDFAELIRLAEMLAEQLNSSQLEARQSVVVLHRAGIRFASDHQNSNLLFLSVTQQFIPQLLAQDMLDVHRFLNTNYPSNLSNSSTEYWLSLVSYRNALDIAIAKSCRRDFHLQQEE
ncbi:GH15208 [Drosophila grimshawi]|uniref:GH15208 n=2 Tax=Drosophila grimshawi TaxID=7222 RepID=B4IXI6_DROGR|nr:GH15208 [Drosophila grimshawi]